MKDQTFLADFVANPNPQKTKVARSDRKPAADFAERDLLMRSLRTIGDVAHALLMITIVGAQPLWVMMFLTLAQSR
jgi:hypothetical protein